MIARAISGEAPRRAVDEMGLELQRQAAHHSEMLQTPLRRLARQGDEGGPVAESLAQLRSRMQDLDPQRHSLGGGGLVLAADVIGRVIRYPFEIPAATVFGVFGAGVFLWLLYAAPRRAHG